MTDEIYTLGKSDGGSGVFFLTRSAQEIYYLGKETPLERWVLIGSFSFSLTEAVLLASWDTSPGSYAGAAGSITAPSASQIRIVPIGGYQIAHDIAPIHYTCYCDFKTQIEFYRGGAAYPTWFTTATEAANNWKRGPFEMALGDDKKIAWGAGDDPLADNTTDAVTFQIWTKK